MDNLNPQSNQNQTPIEPISTPNVRAPKPESPQTRWLIIAILLLAALGLGFWVWSNYASEPPLLNIPSPVSNQPPIDNQSPVADTNIEPPLTSFSTAPEIINPDTSDWKTYRNENYGFEMKYPPEW